MSHICDDYYECFALYYLICFRGVHKEKFKFILQYKAQRRNYDYNFHLNVLYSQSNS
jgi:hypothetical protein